MDISQFKSRKQVTSEQLNILIEYLREHKELARGTNRGRRGKLNTNKLWNECAKKLNNIKDGAVKDRKGWSKYWCDWKYRVKRRYLEQKAAKDSNKPLPEEFTALTPIEENVLSVIGESAMDEVIIKMDPLEEFEHVQDDDCNHESASVNNANGDIRPKLRSHKRTRPFRDSQLDDPEGSSSKQARPDNSEHSDHNEDEAAQFISIEKQKLENSKHIQKSLNTIASELTRLTDVMSDIRDVLVNKINL